MSQKFEEQVTKFFGYTKEYDEKFQRQKEYLKKIKSKRKL